MDSTVLDSSDLDVSQWESENSELFIDGGIPTSEGGATGEDFNLVTKYMPQPLDRSGQPRARSIDIQVNNITAFASEVDGSPWIMVQTGATATYGASDTKLVETMLANDPSRTEAPCRCRRWLGDSNRRRNRPLKTRGAFARMPRTVRVCQRSLVHVPVNRPVDNSSRADIRMPPPRSGLQPTLTATWCGHASNWTAEPRR